MTKTEAIEKLEIIRMELIQGDKFKGRAVLLRKINQRKSFLLRFKCNGNLPALMVKETENELNRIK